MIARRSSLIQHFAGENQTQNGFVLIEDFTDGTELPLFSGTPIYQFDAVASTAAWTRYDPQLLHHAHHVDVMMNLTNLLALKGEPDGSRHHDSST